MRTIKYLIIIFIAVLTLDSCRKIEQLPPIPNIKFTSFAVFDTIDILGNRTKGGRLKFYFEDGDGDLGLNESSKETDNSNLFLTRFKKIDGNMVPASDYDSLSKYTIPYLPRLGQNKILKGTISVNQIDLSFFLGDTLKYDFYIKDRALNESNVVSTCEIVVSVNGIYTN